MEETPGKMYALATVMTLLALAAIVLRFYARSLKKAGFSWDDYMILPAMLFTVGTAICMYIGAAAGDLGRHTKTLHHGSHTRPVFTHRTVVFEQINYACFLTLTMALGFTKCSVLLFYKRIFQGPLLIAAIWVMVGFTSVWMVAFFFSNLLQCWPINLNWTGSGATAGKCINSNMMFLAQAWSDVIIDLLILALPLPAIWAMKMPARHRFAVSGIFLLGGLTVGASIAKLAIFDNIIKQTEEGAVDITYLLTPTIYWPMIESSLGIVGACLPLLRPLFAGKSPQGIVRELRSVVIPSSTTQNDNYTKHSGDVALSQGAFSSASTLKFNSHGLLDEKPSPTSTPSRDPFEDDMDKGIFVQSVARVDDRV